MHARVLWHGAQCAMAAPGRAALMVLAMGVAAGAVAFAVGHHRAVLNAAGDVLRLYWGEHQNWFDISPVRRPLRGRAPRPLTLEDMGALQEHFQGRASFHPFAFPAGDGELPIVGPGGTPRLQTYVEAHPPLPCQPLHVASGRSLTASDEQARALVCVLSVRLARELFPDRDPLGAVVRVDGVPLTVVGVLAENRELLEKMKTQQDRVVVVPYTTGVHRLLGEEHRFWIEVCVAAGVAREAVEQEVATVLRQRHGIGPADLDDFRIYGPTFIVNSFLREETTLRRASSIAAAVAVLAAFAIVANAMMVAVRCRLREFGLKRALGATQRAIYLDVLGFGTCLGLGGAALGAALVLAVAAAAPAFASDAPFDPWKYFSLDLPTALAAAAAALGLALAVSALVARQAIRFDPATVLRG